MKNNLTATDIACVKAYADGGMNFNQAAKISFYTYPNIIYHVNQVKKKTGLDPRNFYDLIKLLEVYCDFRGPGN